MSRRGPIVGCALVALVTLSAWGQPRSSAGLDPAVLATARVPVRRWRYIVVHHTASSGATVASLEAGHRARGMFRGMAYHFVVGNGHGLADGAVAAGTRWTQQQPGAHVASALRDPADGVPLDNVSIGVALVGNFESDAPTAAQRRALRSLVTTLQRRFHIANDHVLGHNEVHGAHTACPGRLLGAPAVFALPEAPPRRP